MAFLAIFGVMLFCALRPCLCGMHRWDEPGGHCEDCGACDELFGKHLH